MYYNNSIKNQNNPPKAVLIGIAITIGVLVAIIVVFAILSTIKTKPKVVPLSAAPSAFTHFVSDKKTFSCLSPIGWAESSQSNDQSGSFGIVSVDQWNDEADFQDGDAKIMIVTDNKAELLGGGEIMSVMPRQSANTPHVDLNGMSGWDRDNLKKSVPGYKEGTVTTFTCPLGQGISAGFTGGHDLHGLAATILAANNNHTLVVGLSNENNWTKARPIFVRMINSLSPGK